MIVLLSLVMGFLLPLFPRAVGGVFLWLSLPYFSDGNGLAGIISLVIAEGISGAIKQQGRNSYTYAKIIGLISCILFTLCNVQDVLKLSTSQQTFSIVIGVFMWGTLIKRSQNKIGASIGAVGAIALGLIGSNLRIPNAIMAMSICMYGIPPLALSLKDIQKEKKEKSEDDVDIRGFLVGIISAMFMGVPPSAFSIFCIKKEEGKIEIQASTEGMGSAFSLLIAIAGLGSRSTVADNISSFGLELDNWSIILVLGISLCSTFIGYSIGTTKKEIKPNYKKEKVKNIIALLFSTAFVLYLLGAYGIIFIFAGLFLAKVFRSAEAPEELGLVGLAAIPLIGLLT